MRGSGSHCGARLGEHLVTLKLLGLDSHLSIPILGLLDLHLELGHNLLEMHALLAVAFLCSLAASVRRCRAATFAAGRRIGSVFLLLLNALCLRFDLRKKRIESARTASTRCRRCLVPLGLRLCAALAMLTLAQRLFYRLLLRYFFRGCGSASLRTRLGSLARHTFLFAFDLAFELFERRRRHRVRALVLFLALLLNGRIPFRMGATRTLRLATGALLLHRLSAGAFFLSLLLFRLFFRCRSLGSGIIGGILRDPELGTELFAYFCHVGIGEHARMAFRGNLHLVKLV